MGYKKEIAIMIVILSVITMTDDDNYGQIMVITEISFLLYFHAEPSP
jgi:hypothetical protein